uniref:Uncharacterized protein n=1 Tax=Rhizophagus irregularis (strain DAOM 181602 / DAOM 197198 / MUCL 43194) TaxID=747089 RepID=U9SI90_RHIID
MWNSIHSQNPTQNLWNYAENTTCIVTGKLSIRDIGIQGIGIQDMGTSTGKLD